jgi:hypothetical protein
MEQGMCLPLSHLAMQATRPANLRFTFSFPFIVGVHRQDRLYYTSSAHTIFCYNLNRVHYILQPLVFKRGIILRRNKTLQLRPKGNFVQYCLVNIPVKIMRKVESKSK